MKSNVSGISDPAEKARWQTNVDMWTVLVGHMEQMIEHMELGGPGMMMGPGGPPPAPKPE